jgi:DNA-binding SARP family transcriptional activator
VTLHLAASPQYVDADGRAYALSTRDGALLAWLAIEGPTPRQRLAALLWPDSAPASARNALRQRLFQLRKQLGVELVTGTDVLALADGTAHDLHDADTVLGAEAGEFGADFSAWLARVRADRAERALARLHARADAAEAQRDWASVMQHAQALLALDPLRESAHRLLMRAHYLRGDRAAALLAFDRCEQLLKHEVGTAPDAQTLALLATITASATADPTTRSSTIPASVLRPPRLIGRDAEWQALQRAWQGRALVLLSGEPGMGKTRLLSDLALAQGAHAVLVTARQGDATVPFALLTRLARALAARGAEPLAARHQRALAYLLPELGGAIPDAAGSVITATALQEALEAVLSAAAAAGLAGVLIDDLQWADAASIEALERLMQAPAPLAWQLGYRSGELSGAAQDLAQHALAKAGTCALTLPPLDVVAIAALVDSLGLPQWSGPALAPALLRRTGGNPMFLLETLKQVVQLPAAGGELALPAAPGVIALIGQRLGRLSAQAMRLARCAAIAGQDFSIPLAEQVLGASALDLADAWAELEAAHVLRDAAFAHDLIQEAALASVPAALAHRLHGLVAKVLTQDGAPPQRVAAHWIASDTPAQAVPHLLEAARRAARAMRPSEATTAALQAADLLQGQGRRDEAFQALVSIFALIYAPADAQSDMVLQRLDQMAATPLERATVADRRADVLARSGDFEGAGKVASEALAELDQYAHPALAARLLTLVAAGETARSEIDRAIERMHLATELASRSGDLDTEAQVSGDFAVILDHAHRSADAYLVHRRAYELALRRPEYPMGVITAAANIAANRTVVGHFDVTLEMCQVCYRVAGDAAIDLPSQWPSLRTHHAYALMNLGEYAQAIDLFEVARADIARYMPSWLPAVDNMITGLWIHLGQWARARRSVQQALAQTQGNLPRYRARSLQLQAQVAAALGEALAIDVEREIAAMGDVIGRVAEHHRGMMQVQALPADEALALAQRLRAEAATRQLPNLVLEAEARCAQAAMRAGLHEQAAAHAREALRRLRDTSPTNLYRGEIWLAAAEALASTAPEGRAAVLRAAETWIRSTAQLRVPESYRDSFLHRNPVNRELLTLASRRAD